MKSGTGPSTAGRSVLLLIVALLVAGGVGAAFLGADRSSSQSLTAGLVALGALLLLWGLLTVRQLARAQAERGRLAQLTAARDEEVAHLATVRMPAILERVQAGQRLDGIAGPLRTPAELGADFARGLATVAEALGSDEAVRRERALRDSVQAAFESVARTMHAMATVQQQVLDQVERDIVDPQLMARVMKADHAAAQMTRKAQTLLVMCGVWPARRETQPVSLYDCVRGAMSRIVEFGRVEVHGGQTLYAAPPAVEGLMHALAELLENATVFSPSPSKVIVSVREVGAGAVIEVDDAGHGMPPDVLEQATAQLRDDLDLARLGAVPRLGLACVGRWMRELGFDVQLSGTSAYGGTRAVTFVPYRLLTEPLSNLSNQSSPARPAEAQYTLPHQRGAQYEPVEQHDSARPQEPAPTASAAAGGPAADAEGLPRRRSRRTTEGSTARRTAENSTARHAAPRPAPEAPAEPWTPEAARASIASVVAGTLRGRAPAAAYDATDTPGGGRSARAADEPPLSSTTDTTKTPDGGQP